VILFPAVDIKDGQCVRLRQGLADEVTVFSPDPEAMARHWAGLGATWLHLVDLDGAFSGKPRNFDLIARICSGLAIPVQLGGGIRDADTAAAYLEAGVRRIIIGTLALADPDAFAAICRAFPGRVGVSLDAVDGRLKVKGWVEDAGLGVEDVLPRLTDQGAAFVVYTDINRDGMQSGVNLPALAHLLDLTGLPVVAAGGVATLDDVTALFPLAQRGLEGVISGRAIYAGTLDFAEALAAIATATREVVA
jgi:phosphoribosylformimino-5-aminoimidazole carboxamide ribotide isomerase